MFSSIKNSIASWLGSLVPGLLYSRRQVEIKRIRKRPNTSIPSDFKFGEGSFFNLHGDYASLQIGEAVSFRRYCHIMLFPGAAISIGKKVFFNNNCSLNCLDQIEIGENTLFGEGVRIYDHNHRYSFDTAKGLEVSTDAYAKAPVKIGRNCWIGSNVTILKGVEIGDNVIVGANCLIYQSIPANSIVKHAENLVISPFH
jgi:acetyltransferase-like isoleucine patch superfamily enzyme